MMLFLRDGKTMPSGFDATAERAVLETSLPLKGARKGKVRDLYECPLPDGSDGLLIIATDRVSAFDVVLESGVPGKGVVLTQISRFWFDRFADQVAHHLVSCDADDIPGISQQDRDRLRGRVMLCRKTRVLPVECVARGYITGSGYKDYRQTGSVCGIPLPEGLVNSDRLDEPLFTPSTKAETGHDENISMAEAAEILGAEMAERLAALTLDLYAAGRDHARECGIILADTKFEFGVLEDAPNAPILIDEVFTPDSSRFWPADDWQPGREQESFDKQYVRNHLETLVSSGRWDKTPPGPPLPSDVVQNTLDRYLEAYRRLTGEALHPFDL